MTADQRTMLRQAVDAAARAAIAASPSLGRMGCAGCGAHRDNNTIGCKRCWERHRQRQLREDAGFRHLQSLARMRRARAARART